MDRYIQILTLNVGLSNNLAGLSTILAVNSVDLILLQEFRSSKEHLNSILGGAYSSEINTDAEHTCSPGTAVAWRNSLPVDIVASLV